MILTRVDLPAPLSPIRPTTSPGSSSMSTPLQRVDRAEMLGDALELEKRHASSPGCRFPCRRDGSSRFGAENIAGRAASKAARSERDSAAA